MNILPDEIFDKCKQIRCIKGPLITDEQKGEVMCGSCGQVLIEKMEDSDNAEYRINTQEQYLDRSRTGPPTSLAVHDQGLATSIDYANRDASGNSLSGYMKETFRRLRTWDTRSKSIGADRNFKQAFMLLDTMKAKLVIPESVVEETAYIYRKAVDKHMTRGRSITSLILASLYAACRATNTPRTLQDIARAGNIRKGDLSLSYRKLVNSLDLRLQPYDPIEFVTRVCSIIGVSEKTRRDAINIISKAKEKEIAYGKNPMSLVAGAIYLAVVINMEKKNQVEIAKACGMTNVTIRNRVKSLREELGIKDPSLILDKIRK
jgi:transcription initiation factor TFIIB